MVLISGAEKMKNEFKGKTKEELKYELKLAKHQLTRVYGEPTWLPDPRVPVLRARISDIKTALTYR
jgi:hypothetical protein